MKKHLKLLLVLFTVVVLGGVLVFSQRPGGSNLYKGSFGTLPAAITPAAAQLITRAEVVHALVKEAKIPLISPPATPTFSDVLPGVWYYESVESAVAAGIIGGHGAQFRPADPLDRAQFTALAVTAFGIKIFPVSKGASDFSDVHESNWFFNSVSNLYSFGGIEIAFNPGDFATKDFVKEVINNLRKKALHVTRAYLAERLVDKLNLASTRCTRDIAPDVTRYYSSCSALQEMVNQNFFSSVPNNNLDPEKIITRAELATIIANAFRISHAQTGQTFTDVPPGVWFYGTVEGLAQNGNVRGYPNGTYGPADPATRWFLRDILNTL